MQFLSKNVRYLISDIHSYPNTTMAQKMAQNIRPYPNATMAQTYPNTTIARQWPWQKDRWTRFFGWNV